MCRERLAVVNAQCRGSRREYDRYVRHRRDFHRDRGRLGRSSQRRSRHGHKRWRRGHCRSAIGCRGARARDANGSAGCARAPCSRDGPGDRWIRIRVGYWRQCRREAGAGPHGNRRGSSNREGEIACNGNRGRGFLRRIGCARNGDRQGWRQRQVLRRGEQPTRTDCAARGSLAARPAERPGHPVLGFPAETMPASNICWAPNSTATLVGDRLTLISLMTVMVASPVFVGSAALVA